MIKSVLTNKEQTTMCRARVLAIEKHGFPRKHPESTCSQTAPVSEHLALVPEPLLRPVKESQFPMIWYKR